VKGI